MEVKQSTHTKFKYRGLNPRFARTPRGLIAFALKK